MLYQATTAAYIAAADVAAVIDADADAVITGAAAGDCTAIYAAIVRPGGRVGQSYYDTYEKPWQPSLV